MKYHLLLITLTMGLASSNALAECPEKDSHETVTELINRLYSLSGPSVMNIDTPDIRPQVYRQIRTNEYMQWLQEGYPTDKKAQFDLKKWMKDQSKAIAKLDDVTIPVVFHILYAEAADKIAEDQVLSQIEALNRDFNHATITESKTRKNEDVYKKEKFDKLKGNVDIKFCLAYQKKGNEVLKGIQYYQVTTDHWTYRQTPHDIDHGGADAWDTEQYLNIWVGRLADSVSGFAQMPGFRSETDGIVVDHRFLGTQGTARLPYHEGKTLTHLVANYLGVPSLWTLRPCADDGLGDTPVHNAPNFGCPGYKHVSLCFRNPSELTMNYLDNTDDACMYMFTQEQVQWMYAALSDGGPRNKLWQQGHKDCEAKDQLPPLSEHKPPGSVSYLTVYPNPATTYLVLESGQLAATESLNVSIRDVMGREVWKQAEMTANSVVNIDCAHWIRGVYFIVINNNVDQPYQKIILP